MWDDINHGSGNDSGGSADLFCTLFLVVLLVMVGLAAVFSTRLTGAVKQTLADKHRIGSLEEENAKKQKALDDFEKTVKQLNDQVDQGKKTSSEQDKVIDHLNHVINEHKNNPEEQSASKMIVSILGFGGRCEHMVFVVDYSGSMVGKHLKDPAPVEAQFVEFKNRLKTLIQEVPYKRFTVIAFAGIQDANWARLEIFEPGLVEGSPSNRHRACEAIDRWRVDGGTPTLQAMEKAMAIEGVDTICLFSDGLPSQPGDQEKVVAYVAAQRMWKHRCIVNAIAVGDYSGAPDGGMKLLDFLRRVAEVGGGSFQGW